jgi:hypothetical protein
MMETKRDVTTVAGILEQHAGYDACRRLKNTVKCGQDPKRLRASEWYDVVLITGGRVSLNIQNGVTGPHVYISVTEGGVPCRISSDDSPDAAEHITEEKALELISSAFEPFSVKPVLRTGTPLGALPEEVNKPSDPIGHPSNSPIAVSRISGEESRHHPQGGPAPYNCCPAPDVWEFSDDSEQCRTCGYTWRPES